VISSECSDLTNPPSLHNYYTGVQHTIRTSRYWGQLLLTYPPSAVLMRTATAIPSQNLHHGGALPISWADTPLGGFGDGRRERVLMLRITHGKRLPLGPCFSERVSRAHALRYDTRYPTRREDLSRSVGVRSRLVFGKGFSTTVPTN
jgi:hypothetical protein